MKLGAQGPQVGMFLEELRRRVTDTPEHNVRERLLGWAEKLAS
jgi:hypothetical protein